MRKIRSVILGSRGWKRNGLHKRTQGNFIEKNFKWFIFTVCKIKFNKSNFKNLDIEKRKNKSYESMWIKNKQKST